jgi:hypothetical protein
MKRKVIKLGPATKVISLPSSWLSQTGTKAGDELEVITEQNSIHIITAQDQLPRVIITASKLERMLLRTLGAKYIQGYEEIEVILDAPGSSRKIQDKVKNLIGMEIVEQNKEQLLIKDIGGNKKDEFNTVLTRLIHLIQSISDEVTNAITKKEQDVEYLEDMEKTVNRFSDYGLRLLNKYGYQKRSKTQVMYTAITQLEELADDYKHLLQLPNQSQRVQELTTQINTHQKEMTKLCLQFSEEKIVHLAKKRDSINKNIIKALKQSTNHEETQKIYHLGIVLEHIMRIMGQYMLLH